MAPNRGFFKISSFESYIVLGFLGFILELSWVSLCISLGLSWSHLGLSWRLFGLSWALLGFSWAVLGFSLCILLTRTCSVLGSFLNLLFEFHRSWVMGSPLLCLPEDYVSCMSEFHEVWCRDMIGRVSGCGHFHIDA